MEEQKKQQLAALELGSEYIAKLIPAMKEIIPGSEGQRCRIQKTI